MRALLLAAVLAVPSLSAQSFRTELIDNGNGFTANETFTTSTSAATGYDAYATWDDATLFFGVTGQDVGDPACDPATSADCPVYEQGQSIDKYLVYYLDTDPLDDATGTTQAKGYGGQSWTLPFNADYLVEIETSGTTSQTGSYTGQSYLYEWDGSAWVVAETASGPNGSSPLVIGDNNTSGYLEFSLDRSAVGSPDFLRTVAWFASAESGNEAGYAYWPSNAPAAFDDAEAGTTSGSTTLEHFYGFVLIDGQYPAASAGQANLDRPFVGGLAAAPVNDGVPAAGSFGGPVPFHSIGYSNSNDFSGTTELFGTSTDADTGYDTYLTWDDQNLYLGVTGSDVGGGDCSDLTVESCDVFELGQSPQKWVVYYVDSDPTGTDGTDQAESFGSQSWTLPFLADYQILVRTDGFTSGEGAYTGVATVKEWDGSAWTSLGPVANLEVFDNSSSGFLKVVVDLDALGSPGFIKTAGWFVNTEDFAATSASDEMAYAYWPADAPAGASADGTTSGATTLERYYGFVLEDAQVPNGSGGLANLDRPFFGTYTCPAFPTDPGDSPGTSRPFHSIPINGSNSFNTANEQFATSTQETADTGYASYFTWDAQRLYLGLTGSDVGGGDCSDTGEPGCELYELGQSPEKWLVYYFDTDPSGTNGTDQAYVPADTIATSQTWTLPFLADVALYVRTDGTSSDLSPYTGTVEVKTYANGAWQSAGPCGVQIYDNNTSGYVELALDLTDLGDPAGVKAAGWVLDAASDTSYAYWPEDAPDAFANAEQGTTTGATTLTTFWGFPLESGVIPNALGNKNRDVFETPEDQATYNTYTVNGSLDANEQLPLEFLGRESTSAPGLYLTWDASALYLSFDQNPLVGTNADLYLAFDTDPAIGSDPQDGTGLITQPDVGPAGDATGAPTYPFAADAVVRLAGAATSDGAVQNPATGELYLASGGSWTEAALPSGALVYRQESGVTEVAVPWTALGLTAADSSHFYAVVYLNDGGNGVDRQWPTANPNAQSPDLTDFYSFYLQEGAEPGSRAYRGLRATQGATLGDGLYGTLALVVPNADQNSATWTLGANTTIVNELYLGQSATLDVGSNSDTPSGNNALRVGRRLTGVGELLARDGTVYTFDPAVGFPEDQEPGGGFATPSVASEIACDVTFNDLTLLNDTEFVSCPSSSGSSARVATTDAVQRVRDDDLDELARLSGPALDAALVARDAADREAARARFDAALGDTATDDLGAARLAAPPADGTSSVTVNGTVDLNGGSVDTGGNTFTLGPDANAVGRESGNRITGGISREVATKNLVSLLYPIGGNTARDLELAVRQWTAKRTVYTVEEISEPAPELLAPVAIEAVSDVRHFTVETEGAGLAGQIGLLRRAEITLPYGPDAALGDPASLRALRTGLFDLYYVDLGGTLEAGSTSERGAVVSEPFVWLGGGLFTLGTTAEAAARQAAEARRGQPDAYALAPSAPNPAATTATLAYELPEAATVRLRVYDTLGRVVATLVDEDRGPGRYEVELDASALASGVYVYRLVAGDFSATRRLTVAR